MTEKLLFNGENLRIARLMSGFSLNELGERVGNTRQYIHQLETSDSKFPSEELIAALAFELNVTPEYFGFPLKSQVNEEECHFRKLKSTLVSSRREAIARATLLNKFIEVLEHFVDLPKVNFPKFEINSYKDAEQASIECRRYWNLGDGPIKNIVRVAENAGAIITTFGEVSQKIDALSLSRSRPVILLNTDKNSSRIRMDIAHEILHICAHDAVETGDKETETQADTFASNFLLPRSALIKEYPAKSRVRIDWNTIYAMKIKWGISARAIIFRLNQEGIINPSQYRTANIHLSKTGQTKTERYDEQVKLDSPELLPNSLRLLANSYGKDMGGLLKQLGFNLDFLLDLTQTRNYLLPILKKSIDNPKNIVNLSAYRTMKKSI